MRLCANLIGGGRVYGHWQKILARLTNSNRNNNSPHTDFREEDW
jgi:hypothetical protein